MNHTSYTTTNIDATLEAFEATLKIDRHLIVKSDRVAIPVLDQQSVIMGFIDDWKFIFEIDYDRYEDNNFLLRVFRKVREEVKDWDYDKLVTLMYTLTWYIKRETNISLEEAVDFILGEMKQ